MEKDRKFKRILTIFLLPFVVAGLVYIFRQKKASEISAIDLISVDYGGTSTPDPIFTLNDLKPGDTVQKCFTVKNVNPSEAFDVVMNGEAVTEEKEFADILEIIISGEGGDIYGGAVGFRTVQNFFDEVSSINLGSFSSGQSKNFCITIKFPAQAGNEYQEASLVFNIAWISEISQSLIPPECRHMTIERIIQGTEGNDKIYGSTKNELILAKGGNDKIWASSGSDCIVGGEGDDYIVEESGDGVVLGGDGNDVIEVGTGNDIVYGGSGNDDIKTGSGNDLVYGGGGDDKIDLGSEDDRAWGQDGNDYIDGGDGNDVIYAGLGNDKILGKTGNDYLYGEEGDDMLYGGSGEDFLDGGLGFDYLYGDSGNDTCIDGEIKNECEI